MRVTEVDEKEIDKLYRYFESEYNSSRTSMILYTICKYSYMKSKDTMNKDEILEELDELLVDIDSSL